MIKISKDLNGNNIALLIEGANEAEVQGAYLSLYNWGFTDADLEVLNNQQGIVTATLKKYLRASAVKIASDTEQNNLAKAYKGNPKAFIRRNQLMAQARLNALPNVTGLVTRHQIVPNPYRLGNIESYLLAK